MRVTPQPTAKGRGLRRGERVKWLRYQRTYLEIVWNIILAVPRRTAEEGSIVAGRAGTGCLVGRRRLRVVVLGILLRSRSVLGRARHLFCWWFLSFVAYRNGLLSMPRERDRRRTQRLTDGQRESAGRRMMRRQVRDASYDRRMRFKVSASETTSARGR